MTDAPRYRVAELAELADTSVDTVRFYQHRGLLDPPRREGRVAYYDDSHVERLRRIRELKDQGLTLQTIKRLIEGIHPADAALVAAVAGGTPARPNLTLTEVADAAGVPVTLLESLVEEGLLAPSPSGSERAYTEADVVAVRAGVKLLDAGVPVDRLLELGRRYRSAADDIAIEAVDLFDEFVRRPVREGDDPDAAAAAALGAFERLLPAASALVGHTFERAVLDAARRRIAEQAAD